MYALYRRINHYIETIIHYIIVPSSVVYEVGSFLDFDWSMGNDFIVSASSDGTCKLWNTSSGTALREITDSSDSRVMCCRFHVHNGNLLLVSSL